MELVVSVNTSTFLNKKKTFSHFFFLEKPFLVSLACWGHGAHTFFGLDANADATKAGRFFFVQLANQNLLLTVQTGGTFAHCTTTTTTKKSSGLKRALCYFFAVVDFGEWLRGGGGSILQTLHP